MIRSMDLKIVVNHLVNGTLNSELCFICLLPLGKTSENVFTKVCTKDMEYCVAGILEEVCHIELSSTDHYNVCSNCFTTATAAYKFYLRAKQSQDILNFYVNELLQNVHAISIPENIETENSLCISLPMYKLAANMSISEMHVKNEEKIKMEVQSDKESEKFNNIVVVTQADGSHDTYRVNENDELVFVSKDSKRHYDLNDKQVKARRSRLPMTYKTCSKCSVKYRFGAKLKEHMKQVHGIDLFICKVCKEIIEGELEFNNHLRMHTDIHTCDICSTIFKKRDTMISHLKWHEESKNLSKKRGARVCEKCGFIVADMTSLIEHYEKKHERKFSCQFCGKMYRGEMSLEAHLRKHEMYLRKEQNQKKTDKRLTESPPDNSVKRNKKCTFPCDTCKKTFADERSLLWHSRLHTNERPFKCKECGRGFVSANRRNHHAVCAHTVPTRRCPLCPALFHRKSMITTHIKKVHLREHKRRNRTSKHQNVSWRTETVPIRELSLSIQTPLLLMQTENIMKESGYQ